MPDKIRESIAEIGVLITLRQELRESFDRDERVLNFVRHAGGKRAEAGEPVAAPNLQLQPLQRGDVGEHDQRSEHLALLPMENRAARAHHGIVIVEGQHQLAVFLPVPGAQRLAQDFAQPGRQPVERIIDDFARV